MGPFSITNMVAGWASGDYWGKLVSFGLGFIVLGFVGFAVYKAYIKKPEPSTEQNAKKIVNYWYQPHSTFGCASTRAWEYEHPSNREVTVSSLHN